MIKSRIICITHQVFDSTGQSSWHFLNFETTVVVVAIAAAAAIVVVVAVGVVAATVVVPL